MSHKIKETMEEIQERIKELCEGPVSYSSMERLVLCCKAYKIMCERYGSLRHYGSHEENPAEYHAAPETEHALSEQAAKKWVSNMENADGTRGPHWTMDKTDEVRKQFSLSCDPLQFWVTMNMMYSDYCRVAEKLGVNTVEFYVCMTKAFLEDPDAQPDKLARYWEVVAGH